VSPVLGKKMKERENKAEQTGRNRDVLFENLKKREHLFSLPLTSHLEIDPFSVFDQALSISFCCA
jgi:hypothetical protein